MAGRKKLLLILDNCEHVLAERAGYDERILYDFGPSVGGSQPDADVLRGADGSLYGTTSIGGNCSTSGGCGIVFKATQ